MSDQPQPTATVTQPRFSYVRYDAERARKQEAFRAKFEELEVMAESLLSPGRYRALFLTELEQAYMWTGKSLRDEQIAVDGAVVNEPHRGNE